MQCEKCGSLMRMITSTIGSNFHGSEAEPDIISGWSCEPAGCGAWQDIEVTPKQLNIKEPCGKFQGGNYRTESQVMAKMRCEDYFEKYKHHFKNGLIAGRTFKAIWLDIKENDINVPSRSWLRKAYLDWVNSEGTERRKAA